MQHWVNYLFVVGFLGTAAGLFWSNARSSKNKQTIQDYKDNGEAQTALINTLRGTVEEHERRLQTQAKVIIELQGQVQTLRDIPLDKIYENQGITHKTLTVLMEGQVEQTKLLRKLAKAL